MPWRLSLGLVLFDTWHRNGIQPSNQSVCHPTLQPSNHSNLSMYTLFFSSPGGSSAAYLSWSWLYNRLSLLNDSFKHGLLWGNPWQKGRLGHLANLSIEIYWMSWGKKNLGNLSISFFLWFKGHQSWYLKIPGKMVPSISWCEQKSILFDFPTDASWNIWKQFVLLVNIQYSTGIHIFWNGIYQGEISVHAQFCIKSTDALDYIRNT